MLEIESLSSIAETKVENIEKELSSRQKTILKNRIEKNSKITLKRAVKQLGKRRVNKIIKAVRTVINNKNI